MFLTRAESVVSALPGPGLPIPRTNRIARSPLFKPFGLRPRSGPNASRSPEAVVGLRHGAGEGIVLADKGSDEGVAGSS